MPRADAHELSRQLGRHAEAVCRRYLPNGCRKGGYWLVGDVANTPGRSLFVRLTGPDSGKGAAGKWTDAATGEHGDLLDLIRRACGLAAFKDVVTEARRFLGIVSSTPATPPSPPRGSRDFARRLFAMTRPIAGTIAETYLTRRGLVALQDLDSLGFHPRCAYRADDATPPAAWPALIAAVTDEEGRLTGVQRSWLAPDGSGKAPVDTPRRALGDLLGNAVRFGAAGHVMAAGEGIETVLSLRRVLPHMPMAAALSAAHLAAMRIPAKVIRLYIAADNDAAGRKAAAALRDRARKSGIEAIVLSPRLKDFNDDLRSLGRNALRAMLRPQLAPQDVALFMHLAA